MSDDDLVSRLRAKLGGDAPDSPEVSKLLKEAIGEIERLRARLAPPAQADSDDDTSSTVRMPLPTRTAARARDDHAGLTPEAHDSPQENERARTAGEDKG